MFLLPGQLYLNALKNYVRPVLGRFGGWFWPKFENTRLLTRKLLWIIRSRPLLALQLGSHLAGRKMRGALMHTRRAASLIKVLGRSLPSKLVGNGFLSQETR